jgi:hypothetical protein
MLAAVRRYLRAPPGFICIDAFGAAALLAEVAAGVADDLATDGGAANPSGWRRAAGIPGPQLRQTSAHEGEVGRRLAQCRRYRHGVRGHV